MRSLRRLPPFLRVVSVIGLLFSIAGLMLLLWLNSSWSPFHAPQADFVRSAMIALNLSVLGMACTVGVAAFNTLLRQPDRRRRISLDSWQRQAWAVVWAVLVPLGGLIINLANPPSFDATYTFLVVNIVVACWLVLLIGLFVIGLLALG